MAKVTGMSWSARSRYNRPMRPRLLPALLVCLAAASCGKASPAAPPSKEAIAAVLDDWHAAAAHADEDRYFGHLADDAVFLGTDAKERWDKAAFLAYAHPH